MTLERFRVEVSIVFEKPRKLLKLYHVSERNEDEQWTDPLKQKIDNKEKFDEVIAEALSLADEATDPTIYAHFDNSSPTSSPGHGVAAASAKSPSSSGSRRSSTDQKNFRDLLLERDGEMCRICGTTDGYFEAAHIIASSTKIVATELFNRFRICSKFDNRNGLILCLTCHRRYDQYEVGIQPTGEIIYSTGLKNLPPSNIFTGLMNQRNDDQPTGEILNYKFEHFINKQSEPSKGNRISKVFSRLSLTFNKN